MDKALRYLENLNKKKRVIYPYTEHIEGIWKLKQIDGKARFGYVGSFSVSTKKAKVYSVEEPAIEWEGTRLIGTEIAKLLLLLNGPPNGYRKITAEQLSETPPPLHAAPCQIEGVYLDIKRCYYHLITKLWGVKYARWGWLGWDKEIGNWHVPEEFKDILEEHKPIRNAIYGIMRAKLRVIWKEENGKITYSVQKTKNELFYPDVPLAIMDITHAISRIAVEKFGAKYVAIDGFILPFPQAKKFKEWLEGLGFQVGIKEVGEVVIKNYYTYRIGKLQTKNFQTIPTAKETQSNLLFTLEEAKEILSKFSSFLRQGERT